MREIALVACVSKKQSRRVVAKDLYISDWFRKARAYAEATADRWYILSARHGLLRPETKTATYEQNLNKMPIARRRAWADRVLKELLPEIRPGDTVIMLAGQRYREFLLDPLRQHGALVIVPMEGLPIGRQLAWLKAAVPSR